MTQETITFDQFLKLIGSDRVTTGLPITSVPNLEPLTGETRWRYAYNILKSELEDLKHEDATITVTIPRFDLENTARFATELGHCIDILKGYQSSVGNRKILDALLDRFLINACYFQEQLEKI